MAKLNNNAIVTQLDMADYKTSVKRIFTKIFIIQQKEQGHQKTKRYSSFYNSYWPTMVSLINKNLSQVPIAFSNLFAVQRNQINKCSLITT